MRVGRTLIVALLMMGLFVYLPSTDAATDIYEISPDWESTVSGETEFSIVVSSDVDVVSMYIDGELLGYMDSIALTGSIKFFYIMHTEDYADGVHTIRYEVEDVDVPEVNIRSVNYIFDNSAPVVDNITVHYYKEGYEASGNLPVYITASISDMTGVDNISVNASCVGTDSITMYDDGEHNDAAKGDGIYGTDWFYPSNSTGVYYLNLSANDTLDNRANYPVELKIDLMPPSVYGTLEYPAGQSALKSGDEFRIIGEIRDYDPSGVGGILHVYGSATELGLQTNIGLFDDGQHMDGTAGDGIYGSEVLTISESVNGQKNIYIYAEDIAGNVQSYTMSVLLDSDPPSISDIVVEYPSGQTWVKDGQSISIKVNASDSTSGIAKVLMDASSIGGSDSEVLSQSGSYYISSQIPVSTGEYTGALRVKITAIDGAGNGYSRYVNIVVNNTAESSGNSGNGSYNSSNNTSSTDVPPSIESVSIWNGEHLSGDVEISIVVWNQSALANNMPVLYVGTEEHPMSGSGGVYSVVLNTSEIGDGERALTFVVRDENGLSDTEGINVVIDNSPPELKVVSEYSGPVSGTIELRAYSSDVSGISRVSMKVNGNDYGDMAPAGNGVYAIVLDTGNLQDGENSIEIISEDIFGHISSVSMVLNVDNTAPMIKYLGSDRIERNGTVSFRITGAERVWWAMDGGEWMPFTINFDTVNLQPGPLVSSEGMHYISIRAVDEAGNENESSAQVYIEMPKSSDEQGNTDSTPMEERSTDGSFAQGTMYILILALILMALALITVIYSVKKMSPEKVPENTGEMPGNAEESEMDEDAELNDDGLEKENS